VALNGSDFCRTNWKEAEDATKKMEEAVASQNDIRAYRLLMWAFEEGARSAIEVLAEKREKGEYFSVDDLRGVVYEI
jgi:hypothetical protein